MKKIILYLLLCVSIVASSQPQTLTNKTWVVTNAGGTLALTPSTLPSFSYIVASGGSVTLANDYSITLSALPAKGSSFKIYINGEFNLNGHTFTVLGQDVKQYYVSSTAYRNFYFEFFVPYDGISANTLVFNSFGFENVVSGTDILDATITPAKLTGNITRALIDTTGRGRVWVGTGANTTSTLYAAGSGKVLLGDGSDLTSVAVTGDIGISSTGVTSIAAGAIVNADVSSSAAIARSKLAAGTASQVVINDGAGALTSEATLNPLRGGLGADVSSSTGFVTFSAGSSTVGALVDSKTFTVSFESGEQCNNRFKMPCAGTITGAYAVCTKAIAGTDAGTIVLKNAAGTTMTAGTITFAASDPLETAYTVTPSANNSFSAGDILYAVTSKSTAGGKVLLTITYNRVN